MASQGLRNLITLLNYSALNGTYKTSLTGNLGMQSARSLAYANKIQEPSSRNEREQGDTRGDFSEVDKQTNLPQQQFRGENTLESNDGMGTFHINKSRQVLIDELSNIYAQYKNSKNVDEIMKHELGPEIPEELRPSVYKAREMYIASLEDSHSSSSGAGGEAGCSVRIGPGKVKRSHSDFLGIQTVYGDIFRSFSAGPALGAKADKVCDKAKKLPCLQPTELSKKPVEEFGKKRVCERFCMPCCKPARDPPTCTFPYVKPPCEKIKPPRAAFSECKKIFPLKRIEPCECVRALAGSCKKSQDADACPKA